MQPSPVAASDLPPPQPVDWRGVQAVLFDVYGTILQSASGEVGVADARALDRAGALQAALDAAGWRRMDDTAGAVGVAAMRDAVAQSHTAARHRGVAHPEVDIELIWRVALGQLAARGLAAGASTPAAVRRLAVEYECRVNPVWPMPGFPDMLGSLRARGLKLGIVSNAQFFTPLLFPALAGGELADLGFEPDLCVWSYQHGTAKPGLEIFAPALRVLNDKYGIPPSRTLMVGNDMLNDVAAAQQCGCRAALFAGDARSLRRRADDARCQGVQPDAVLYSLAELASDPP